MRRRCLLLCVCVLLLSGGYAIAQVVATRSNSNYIFRFTSDTSDPSGDWAVKKIDIVSRKDGHTLQTIVPGPNNAHISGPGNSRGPSSDPDFVIEDMNFDGYKDFRLKAGISDYNYWTFDPHTHMFRADTLWQDFNNPVFDPVQKVATSSYSGRSGFGTQEYKLVDGRLLEIRDYGGEFNDATGDYLDKSTAYTYVKGQLVETTFTRETYNEKTKLYTITVSKLANGQTKVVSRKTHK